MARSASPANLPTSAHAVPLTGSCFAWATTLRKEILNSPAYKQGGVIMITFDEGSDSTACCGETAGKSPSHPNVALPGGNGPGGGRVGAVLLSPFIKPGTVSAVDYNHYSMLRTIEDIFGVSHLGDAAMPQVKPFGSDVFTKS